VPPLLARAIACAVAGVLRVSQVEKALV
jgi:hypothetical protein